MSAIGCPLETIFEFIINIKKPQTGYIEKHRFSVISYDEAVTIANHWGTLGYYASVYSTVQNRQIYASNGLPSVSNYPVSV